MKKRKTPPGIVPLNTQRPSAPWRGSSLEKFHERETENAPGGDKVATGSQEFGASDV